MIFARFGHGPCYYHWNEIFAGVGRQKGIPKGVDETHQVLCGSDPINQKAQMSKKAVILEEFTQVGCKVSSILPSIDSQLHFFYHKVRSTFKVPLTIVFAILNKPNSNH